MTLHPLAVNADRRLRQRNVAVPAPFARRKRLPRFTQILPILVPTNPWKFLLVDPAEPHLDVGEHGWPSDGAPSDHQAGGSRGFQACSGRDGVRDIAVGHDGQFHPFHGFLDARPIRNTGVPLAKGSSVNAQPLRTHFFQPFANFR